MKKIIAIIISIQLILGMFTGVSQIQMRREQALLYENNTSLVLNIEGIDEEVDFLIYLNTLMDEYDLSIHKHVFQNEQNLTIYSTDTSLNNKVELKEGRLPNEDSIEFISNQVTSDSNQVGLVKQINPQLNITIYDIMQVEHAGINGIYYVSTQDNQSLNRLISEFNTIGVMAEEVDFVPKILSSPIMILQKPIDFAILCCGILVMIRWVLSYLKEIAILNVHGYSKMLIGEFMISRLMPPFFKAIGVTLLLWTCTYLMYYTSDYYLEALGVFVKLAAQFIFVYLMVAVVMIVVYLNSFNINSFLKGNQPFSKSLQWINGGLKVISSFLFIVILSNLITTGVEVKTQQDKLSYWGKTENIYNLAVQYMGVETSFTKEQLDLYEKSEKLLQSLIEEEKVFIIEPQNYLDEFEDYNSLSDSGKIHHNTITVSESYFRYNPIITTEGDDVRQLISDNPLTLNVVVPESYKEQEELLKSVFSEIHYFEAIDLHNVFAREMGLDYLKTDKDDLKLNLIYVKEAQSYFTYNQHYAQSNKNHIVDPIAIIYQPEDYHVANSYALLTAFTYYYSTAVDPYQELLPEIIEYEAESIKSVTSVYSELGHDINTLNLKLLQLIASIIIIIIAVVMISYHFISSYYLTMKERLWIYNLYGYSFFHSYYPLIMKLFVINFLISCSSLIFMPLSHVIVAVSLLIFMDIIIIYWISRFIKTKQGVRGDK